MAKFYIGQRVRIVADYSGDHPDSVGYETRVTAEIDLYETCNRDGDGTGFMRGYCVAFPNSCYGELVCEESELEPIQYDGMRPVRWEDCLWQPEHYTVTLPALPPPAKVR